MNIRFLRSNLIETLRNSVAALADSSPLLPAPMAHRGFDGFLSDRHKPGISLDRWFTDAQARTPGNFGNATNKRRLSAGWLVKAPAVFFGTAIYLVASAPAVWAHGGASVEIDTCRIPVGNHWVHFTAYTPAITGDTEHCRSVPNLSRTNLVFDYEGEKLRNRTVAFEITKEPEGSRVYYQEPKTQKTGSVNAVVDFNRFGAGDYLIHVTLVNEGQKIDAHLPISVGSGGGVVNASWLTVLLAVGLIAVFFFVPSIREKLSNLKKRGQRPA